MDGSDWTATIEWRGTGATDARTEDALCSTPRPKQTLQVLTTWDQRLCHPRLQVSSRLNRIQRREHFEFFPVAIASCVSWTCLGIFRFQFDGPTQDFSVGLMPLEMYKYDQNLADCLGKLPYTWGLLLSDRGSMELWSAGKKVTAVCAPKPKDRIALLLDLNVDEGGDGSLHVFLNNTLLFSFDGVPSGWQYAMASTLSPNCSVALTDDAQYAQSLLTALAVPSSIAALSPRSASPPMRVVVFEAPCNAQLTPSPDAAPEPAASNPAPTLPASGTAAVAACSGDRTPASTPVPSFFSQRPLLAMATPSKAPQIIGSGIGAGAGAAGPNAMECCVCMSATRCVLFMPCKHLCTCETCGMVDRLGHCPMCRLRIKSRMKIFL